MTTDKRTDDTSAEHVADIEKRRHVCEHSGCELPEREGVPTQWAYDQACKALHAQRARADKYRAALQQIANATAPDNYFGHIAREALKEIGS